MEGKREMHHYYDISYPIIHIDSVEDKCHSRASSS